MGLHFTQIPLSSNYAKAAVIHVLPLARDSTVVPMKPLQNPNSFPGLQCRPGLCPPLPGSSFHTGFLVTPCSCYSDQGLDVTSSERSFLTMPSEVTLQLLCHLIQFYVWYFTVNSYVGLWFTAPLTGMNVGFKRVCTLIDLGPLCIQAFTAVPAIVWASINIRLMNGGLQVV